MKRRHYLGVLAAATTATAGCVSRLENAIGVPPRGEDRAGEGETPVTDDGSDGDRSVAVTRGSTPERTLTVDVLVVDEGGTEVANEPVRLIDRGGTRDERVVWTDENGRGTFIESVGPPPCNPLTLALPERNRTIDLGCHNGAKTVTRRIVVGDGAPEPGTTETPAEWPETPSDVPVVDNRGSTPARTITIDVRVEADGSPVGDVDVVLRDTGGTDDRRVGTTDGSGRVVFVEGVGPPPCNPLSLRVPEHGVVEDLGCQNGGRTIESTIGL